MFLPKTLHFIHTHVMKPGGRFLPGFIFICLLFLSPTLSVAQAVVPALVEHAETSMLAQNAYWQTLLHYRSSWRGAHSLIDDPDFFLAEDGSSNPEAELAATIRGFFQPVSEDVDTHPRCRFPARYAWLDEHLDLTGKLDPLVCPEFERIKAEIQPQSAELIFPGSNFNNPASMFGHTLVSINGPHQSKLLSHALNYSAFTQEKNGIAYAVKGIFGFYKGYYSTLPYYAKLKQYNDLERRDIWEYDLNLDADEMQRMFNHIWELRDIYSDYYFFDENCAYQLLFLFDIARPSLGLVDKARPWVIPVDTVRLLETAGVVSGADYRPSKATRISWVVDHMSSAEKDLAEQLLLGEVSPEVVSSIDLALPGKIRVLDLAIETLEFQYLKHELERPEYRKRYLALLKERSYLVTEEPVVPKIMPPVRPDKGHGSNRVALLVGEIEEEPFTEFRLRPAYHNLLDADDGYLAGSQIDFADIAVRYYQDQEKVRLHSFRLVNIMSLAPRHRFYKPVSWKLDFGFKRQAFSDGIDRMLFSLNPGGGFTFGHDERMVFLLFETEAQISDHFRDNYLLGFGGSLGFLTRLGENLKLKLDVRQVEFIAGDNDQGTFQAAAAINWRLGVNSSLLVEASRESINDLYSTEISAGINLYW